MTVDWGLVDKAAAAQLTTSIANSVSAGHSLTSTPVAGGIIHWTTFVSDSDVLWNGSERATLIRDDGQVLATTTIDSLREIASELGLL
ncbi:hypothetical protein [Homoserinimonas hongtaonis]|uniref:hypothetical protein n=1 Tax=Homoserinimonas hongtaonis TaxID=2079791 RepID=UPI0011B25990|nr:hypothetical protein [Salinibacterium hongtaonis]